ncbi:carbohydrate ABC transporter substrate-binding protein, CUT1 family (TC 3.A.1.1.-) [Paenibacillus uliginis N3/975]|uniref:Carbohydrate ABC transporter substrate-binding protein, CUT1 family (TC 3.A.1.1.-) n=1 Tax=Paenibacillus uliginis N3/975 TaxID=1313296 RepID=A0A1X7HS36_9BACL|nr:extracellular solute-binding protein [Paenibacillus uliginis]SMF91721.1 carbohydrate ABC transporter substrate-binding protein, CUT1 family (TC 3.A.1.1.-) [Paenibacillus uliginis N3/975]
MSKKWFSMALVLTMFASLLAACGGGKEATPEKGTETPPKETTTPADPNQYGDTGGLTLPLVDKPTKITWMLPSDKTDINTSLIAKEIEKRTGITVDFQAYSKATYKDKIRVVVASGKLPDIFHGLFPDELKKIGKQKAVVAINEYVDMLPNFKKLYMEENPWVLSSYGDEEGNLYSWPIHNLNRDVNHGFMYRKDIFDEVGIKEWTNTDEFYQALKALKEKYPDSYPYASKYKEFIFREWSYGWGISGTNYPMYYDESAKVWKFASIQPEHKEMLDFMKKLYNEGLLDPEFLTDTQESWTSKMTTSNKAFVTYDWIGRLDMFYNQIKDTNPKYDLRYGNPVGPAGNGMSLPKIDASFGIAVTNNDKKEAALKLLDYLTSPSGATLVTMGVEGETFKMEGDKVVYPELTDVPLVDISVLEDRYGLWLEGMYLNPDRRSVYYNFTEKEQEAQDKRMNANSFEPLDPVLNFTDAESAILAELQVNLEKSSNEFNSKYVLNKNYGDAKWAEWQKTAAKQGADKMAEIFNAAQQRFDAATK